MRALLGPLSLPSLVPAKSFSPKSMATEPELPKRTATRTVVVLDATRLAKGHTSYRPSCVATTPNPTIHEVDF